MRPFFVFLGFMSIFDSSNISAKPVDILYPVLGNILPQSSIPVSG